MASPKKYEDRMDIDKRGLFEMYRNGLRVGIRRGSGSSIVAAFNALWQYHRDFLVEQELQLVGVDELWGSLALAAETTKTVQGLIKAGKEDAAKRAAFKFIRTLALAKGNRSPYYLMRVATEPWIKKSTLNISRQLPKRELDIALKITSPLLSTSFWSPLQKAAKQKATKDYVRRCRSLYDQSITNYDKRLVASAAIKAVVEPSAVPVITDAINCMSVHFGENEKISWNFVHPDSYVGGVALSEVSKLLRIPKSTIRIAWLTKYVDREINASRSLWQSIYTSRANVLTSNTDWHNYAVHLMVVCHDWINTYGRIARRN